MAVFLIASCNEQSKEIKTNETPPSMELQYIPVQQGSSGKVTVIAYYTAKDLKKGKDSIALEFNEEKSREPVKVSNVKVNALTHINGKEIPGEISLAKPDSTGRYWVNYNLTEKGLWYFNLNFNDSSNVQLIFSVI